MRLIDENFRAVSLDKLIELPLPGECLVPMDGAFSDRFG
jgi:hypothetical protein